VLAKGGKVQAAKWYPDPVRRHQHRYWNGSAWTQYVSDAGQQSLDSLTPATPVTPVIVAAPPEKHYTLRNLAIVVGALVLGVSAIVSARTAQAERPAAASSPLRPDTTTSPVAPDTTITSGSSFDTSTATGESCATLTRTAKTTSTTDMWAELQQVAASPSDYDAEYVTIINDSISAIEAGESYAGSELGRRLATFCLEHYPAETQDAYGY
jgi:uncharacterized protein DUF2510